MIYYVDDAPTIGGGREDQPSDRFTPLHDDQRNRIRKLRGIAGGLRAKFANGTITFGGEYGGIGSDFQTSTFKARGQVPFSAQ